MQQQRGLRFERAKVGTFVVGVLAYVLLQQVTPYLPNPLVITEHLQLHLIVPVVAGYFGGSLPGALVGLIGSLVSLLLEAPLGAGGDLPRQLLLLLPHTIMGAVAGWARMRRTRMKAALVVLVGYGLDLTARLLGGELALSTLLESTFWTGLLADGMVNLILVTLSIGIIQSVRGQGPGFAWKRVGLQRYVILVAANLIFLVLLTLAYRQGVSLAVYLFAFPVVFTALTLGVLETWVLVGYLILLPAAMVLGLGLRAVQTEVAFILTLDLVALTMGELAGDLQEQRDLARSRLEELRQAYAILMEADKLKDQMIQNISHELRTPLSMVLGYIELLSTETWGALSPEQREATRVVRKNVRSLSSLVEKITVLEQVRLGEITHHPTSLDTLAQIQIDARSGWAEEHNCSLSLETGEKVPPLLGDARALGRAVEALIDNAVKFSPDGGQVTIKTWEEKGRAYLAVSDEGIGIAEEQQQYLFRDFYQIDGSTTRRFGGMGTGLALVRETVRAHGGDVWVESVPGDGSTFGLWIPLAPGRERQEPAPVFITQRPLKKFRKYAHSREKVGKDGY
ncbi:MAG: sensor histidine kinase [Anaerolineales bacterium]